MFADELFVDPAVLDEDLQRSTDESKVGAGVDRKERISHLRPEERALDARGNPIVLKSRLTERIDNHDLGPPLSREVEILHEDRLGVGDVGAEQNDKVALDHVAVRTRRRGDADRLPEGSRRRGVAHACRVVDVVRAEETRDLLRRVVRLVGESASCQVEPDPLRCGGADAGGRKIERVVPADPSEPSFPAPTEHRVGKAPERAQGARRPWEGRNVGERSGVERTRRVQLEEVEARGAEVDAFHGPVAKASDTERAAVADAPREDPPRVWKVVAVVPDGSEDLEVVVRLRPADPVRDEADP